MRILFLSAWFPYPPTNGAKIRVYNLLREIGKSHEVTLLSLARTIPIAEARRNSEYLGQYCVAVEVVPAISFYPKGLAGLKGIASFKPRSIVQTDNPEMAKLIEQCVHERAYDVVVASEVSPPSIISTLATNINGIPKLLDGLEFGIIKDSLNTKASVIQQLRRRLTWLKHKKFAARLLAKSDACTVPSTTERINLLDIAPNYSNVEVIPHGLDLSIYSKSMGIPQRGKVSYTGSFSYFPNLDAVTYFLDKIYPKIKKVLSATGFQVIGDTHGIDLSGLSADNSVCYTGLLRDVRPEVASSWLSVVPLRYGGGTRLKIIESMALGTPVVSTSKGAEGLEVEHEKNILIADDPEEFADAVVKVLQNVELREKLSEAGIELVQQRYSSEVMGKKFVSLLERVI